MVTLEELYGKLDELITELKSGRGSGDGGGNGRTISMPSAEALRKAGDKALGGLGAVGSYGLAAGALFQSIAGKKDAVLSALDALANSKLSPPGLKLAVEQARLASDPNAQAVKSGANTEMFRQRANEIGTGVSYADQFKNANSAGTGLTSAGTLTGDKFDTLNQTLIKLNKDQLAKDRFANGLTDTDTLAKALILSQQRSTGNLNKPEDQDRAVVNAGKISDEIDKTAKVMRTSREDIANQTAERLKDGSVQAALTTLQTDQQRASFIQSQVGLTAFGKDVQDLAKDFTMFGGPTQKTMETMVALGPAGRELGAAMKDLKSATNEQQRAAAEERLERAKGMINERQRDPRAARLAMAAEAFPEVKALQGFKRQFEQNRAAEGYNFQRNQGETSAGAMQATNDQYKNLQQGRGQGGEQLSADAKMQGVILSGDRQAALGASTAMNRLNEEFNKSPEKIDAIIKKLKEFGPPAKPIAGDTAVRPPPIKETRDTGTLGETGKMFEPKDIVALLHKGERVLNPKENTDLTNLFGMVSSLKSKTNDGLNAQSKTESSLANMMKDSLKSTASVGLTAQAKTETSLASMMKDLQTTKKEEPLPEPVQEVASAEPEQSGTDSITLKDLHDSLQRLNSTMELMASHTADMKDTNRTTADMSQKMTGNRLAV